MSLFVTHSLRIARLDIREITLVTVVAACKISVKFPVTLPDLGKEALA